MKEERYIEYVSGLNTRRSWELYSKARKVIPGGASSHARCYPVFDPYPLGFVKGEGSRIWDVDGNEYVDFVLALGPIILGHRPKGVIEAVKAQLDKITMYVGVSELEVKVAEKIKEMVPNVEMVRFSNSGTEATMHAIRMARGHTGKDKIVKFEGCYHGAHDYVLVSGMGTPPLGPSSGPYKVPASWGIPEDTLKTVIVLPWNDLRILEKAIKKHADEIAAVITEPVMMNIGTVIPEAGYLNGMQELCIENDIVFILDEVITGFRLAPGGAQEYFDIEADLVIYGKALGAGFPISAIAGKREIFQDVVPGKITHAGTYNANPICLAATLAALNELSANGGEAYKHLNKVGIMLKEGLEESIDKMGAHAIVQGLGSVGCQLYLTELKEIKNYRDAFHVDRDKFVKYHKELLKRGIYIHPSQHEHMFISTAHTEEDIEKHLSAATEALKAIL